MSVSEWNSIQVETIEALQGGVLEFENMMVVKECLMRLVQIKGRCI